MITFIGKNPQHPDYHTGTEFPGLPEEVQAFLKDWMEVSEKLSDQADDDSEDDLESMDIYYELMGKARYFCVRIDEPNRRTHTYTSPKGVVTLYKSW